MTFWSHRSKPTSFTLNGYATMPVVGQLAEGRDERQNLGRWRH